MSLFSSTSICMSLSCLRLCFCVEVRSNLKASIVPIEVASCLYTYTILGSWKFPLRLTYSIVTIDYSIDYLYAFRLVLACDRIANYRVGYYYPTQRFGASLGPRGMFMAYQLINYQQLKLKLHCSLLILVLV